MPRDEYREGVVQLGDAGGDGGIDGGQPGWLGAVSLHAAPVRPRPVSPPDRAQSYLHQAAWRVYHIRGTRCLQSDGGNYELQISNTVLN